MRRRQFGRTAGEAGEIGFGARAIGADRGPVEDGHARAALEAALDAGMDVTDAAAVRGDGRSERLIADLPALAREATARVRAIPDAEVRPSVHRRW